MTMLDQRPVEEVVIPLAPIPSWVWMRRNQVKVTYVSESTKGHRTLVGRITAVSSSEVTILHDKSGEPTTLHRGRIRGIVVMKEGDVAGRARITAVRALGQAAKALADPNHVGGNQREAADLLAFVVALIPALQKGDAEHIWSTLQALGAEIG
jgi:hypothetical protein